MLSIFSNISQLLFGIAVIMSLSISISKIYSYKEQLKQARIELEQANHRCEQLADNARRCLAREAKAQADAAERNAILNNATVRDMTDEEKAQVVDDETLDSIIDRLNRGL